MIKTSDPVPVVEKRLAVTLPELQTMLCTGRHTAVKIAREAGAELKIGGRRLYHVGKIDAYLSARCEEARR